MIQNIIFGFFIFHFFFFFENIISGIQRSHIRPHVSVNIIRDFFLFSDFLEESILSDFANFPANMFQFSVRKSICAALFLDTQEPHSWSTLKANVCVFLYISVRNFLFQRRSKVLSDGDGLGGGWIVSLKRLALWA